MGKKINFSGRSSSCKVSTLNKQKSSKVSSVGKYHKTTLKGNRWGVKELSTNPKLETNPHYDEEGIKNNNGIKYCLNCGKQLTTYEQLKAKNQVCNNSCRKELTQKNIAEENRIKNKIKNLNKKHKRKCQRCGKLCWPNYFFCKRCQPDAISSYEYEEYEA